MDYPYLETLKNTFEQSLSIVGRLLEPESRNSGEGNPLLEDRLRRRTMAFVHESLNTVNDRTPVNVTRFVRNIIRHFSRRSRRSRVRIHIITELQPVELAVRRAVPFALVLAEMIQNIYQHAYGDRAIGRARISLRKEAGRVELRVEDYGRGVPKRYLDNVRTTGFTVMHTLAGQLEGELAMKNKKNRGFRVSLRFPV